MANSEREAVPLMSQGEEEYRRPHPCRNMTLMLVMSLLVNALCMSVIMTTEMEHSAEHLVAKTNQLRAVGAAPPAGYPRQQAASPPAAKVRSSPATKTVAPLADSPEATVHKARAATHVLSHLGSAHAKHKPATQFGFNIDEFRLALLKRREERDAGHTVPLTPLRTPAHLRDSDDGENPNAEPEAVGLVDSRGAFFDPKLGVLVDAKLLGTRAKGKMQEAAVLAAEHKEADKFLPQLGELKTEDDAGHLVSVKEDEASQLAHGIFTWGYENPDTGDIRVDCTDTLANSGSNGGQFDRFWGGAGNGDACGPRNDCEDECAYTPCNIGTVYKVECPGHCGHYGADVFGGAGRTANVFMDDSSICRAALSVGEGSLTHPFFVYIKVVEAQPAYEGRLHMVHDLTTFNYVWHRWDWSENPKYSIPYTSSLYACCSNPGAGAVPHLGEFTPNAEFRMRYDGIKWVNRVAFTVVGGDVSPEPEEEDDEKVDINEPPVCPLDHKCPHDGEGCCKVPPPDDPCMQPDAPATCPCGGAYTEACPDPPPRLDCSINMALQFNGAEGDGAELEDSNTLKGKFQEKLYAAVTVEMWVKDNTLPMHRTVYFGGGEFKDQGFNIEESCIQSGFSLGQWNGMLTFDVATVGGMAGAGCGVHVRSPDWVLGTHKGAWVHVAGTYSSARGETNLYIDGKVVHTDYVGAGAIVWPALATADTAGVKWVMGRNGDYLHTGGGSTGMDGELDEVRVWTEARSLDHIIALMHKSTPDTTSFGSFPMSTVALYFRFECQQGIAATYHRVCSNAEWPMAIQLGSSPTTLIVESEAPIELLTNPIPDNCPPTPALVGPTSWTTWSWKGGASGAKSIGAEEASSGETYASSGENYMVANGGTSGDESDESEKSGDKTADAPYAYATKTSSALAATQRQSQSAGAKSMSPHHKLHTAAHRMLTAQAAKIATVSSVHGGSASAHGGSASAHGGSANAPAENRNIVWDPPGTKKNKKIKAIWHKGMKSTQKSSLHKLLVGTRIRTDKINRAKMSKGALLVSAQAY